MLSTKVDYFITQTCDVCHECCWNEKNTLTILFTAEEVKDIIASVPLPLPNFSSYRGDDRVFTVDLNIMEIEGQRRFVCPFYDETSFHCRIYNLRPFDCRIWPFFFAKGKDPQEIALCYYDKWCRRVGDSQAFNPQTIVRFINSHTISVLREYPRLIWDYAEEPSFKTIQRIDHLLEP